MAEFKDTMMAKMTIEAIKSWGENDKDGNWYSPTHEQAEEMVSQGGVYDTSEKATNNKTYGSEVAAIIGLVEQIAKREGLADDEKKELVDQIKEEVYTQEYVSDELAQRIKLAMEVRRLETSIVEILGTIHDNWIRDNGNKFDDPNRAKKLYQFVDLRAMTFNEDGAIADLKFLQPIIEGSRIEVDLGKLEEEFLREQKEYMEAHGMTTAEGIRKYMESLETSYPPVAGLTTTKGKTVDPVLITDELKKEEILERMTKQVCEKLGIEYIKEVKASDIARADKGENITEAEVARSRSNLK